MSVLNVNSNELRWKKDSFECMLQRRKMSSAALMQLCSVSEDIKSFDYEE